VLQLGESLLGNCCWKLRCIAVTDSVLINNFTAPLQHHTVQCSISATFWHPCIWWQYGNAAWQSHWFSNLKNQQVFLWILCMCRIIYWKLCVNELLN
jgi:hypothetical protein